MSRGGFSCLTPLDTDSLLTGATDVSTIVPSLTSQLDSLQSKISSVQSAVSDVSGSDGLSLLQAAGVSGLLNRVYNAVATLLDGVTTVTCKLSSHQPRTLRTLVIGGANASLADTSLGSTLDPVTTLVNQIVTSLGPILNLNLIQGTSL